MGSEYYRIPDAETRLRTLVHGFGLVVVAYFLGLVASQVTVVGISSFGISVESTASLPPLPYAVLNAALFVGFFLAVFAYLRWQGFPDLFEVEAPSVRDLGWVVAGFVGLFVLAYALTTTLDALGIDSATNTVIDQGRNDPVRFLYMIPVTLLFVAPAEELLFRGTVQGLFRKAYGVVPGVLFASAIFGLGHWFALAGTSSGKLRYVAVAAMLGIVLGALYELTENLVVPILVHAAWNSFSFVTNYVEATGVVALFT